MNIAHCLKKKWNKSSYPWATEGTRHNNRRLITTHYPAI